jgi:type II secretory pathway pseudopilin PulG
MTTRPTARPVPSRRGVTLVEALVVVAVIAALLGILLPALSIIRRNAQLVSSQSNLRQIGALVVAYGLDNRDYVVPSQFDYSGPFSRGVVRSASPAGALPPTGPLNRGSWADILWTYGKFGPIGPVLSTDFPSPLWDYRYDSPDYWAYTIDGLVDDNILRSTVIMTRTMPVDSESLARPFGTGASIREQGQPGYFAANDFFNAVPDSSGTSNWYTTASIRYPAMSLYIVDSRAGETIPPPVPTGPNQWDPVSLKAWSPNDPDKLCEVDFRYVGDVCSILYLDGHVNAMGKWVDYDDLRRLRQTRVDRLDQRN